MILDVVIPAYNAADTIGRVIDAWHQPGPRTGRIIVVDDGSSDATSTIARARGAEVIRFPQNRGRGAARAAGLEAATTTLVIMCDATIVPLENFMNLAVTLLDEPSVAAVFASLAPFPATDVASRWRNRHLFKARPSLVNRKALLATGLCALRRSCILAAGGFAAALRSGEDADLGGRLLAGGWEVILHPGLQGESVSQDSARQVMRRYARWNSPQGVRGRAWWRQLAYAVKVMARQDLRERDPAAALLSLTAPFYQLRRR